MKCSLVCLGFLIVLLIAILIPLGCCSTTETRYMRSNYQTINGLYANVLGTSQSSSYLSAPIGESVSIQTYYFGIRVWKRVSGGTETEITSGTAVSIASGSTSGLKTGAAWNCPQTSLLSTDAIVVRVYADTGNPPTILWANYITEQLGASQLDATAWTAYYYLYRASAGGGLYNYYFRYGTSTYNSRIANFQWTAAAVTKNFYGTISPSFSVTKTKTVTFNRQGLITQTFALTSISQFISAQLLNLFGTIVQQFTVTMQKGISFNCYGLVNPTFTPTSTVNFITMQILFLYGIIACAFTVAFQKGFSFNLHSTINPSFTITTATNFVSAQIINLYGLITQAFSIPFQKTFVFNLHPTINLPLAVAGKMEYWYGIILNFYGSIVQSFTVTFQKALTFNIYQSILEHFTFNHQKTWSFNMFPTIIETFAVSSAVNCWVGTILNLSGMILFQFAVLVYTNLMMPTINLAALGLSVLGFILCLYPLTEDDDSAKALAVVTLILSLAGVAFTILGLAYALGIGAVAFVLSIATIALALATKKD